MEDATAEELTKGVWELRKTKRITGVLYDHLGVSSWQGNEMFLFVMFMFELAAFTAQLDALLLQLPSIRYS